MYQEESEVEFFIFFHDVPLFLHVSFQIQNQCRGDSINKTTKCNETHIPSFVNLILPMVFFEGWVNYSREESIPEDLINL